MPALSETAGTETPSDLFALYVHWPFCLKKCPYCDFNSHVSPEIDQDLWRNALLKDLGHYGQVTKGRALTSVFFGGGTPSLMAAETVAAVLGRAGDYWQLPDDLEVTLEANPTSTEADRFRDYKAAGVNRLSLGIQSFDDNVLKQLGREHSSREAQNAIALSQQLFQRTSFDLIYATPGQTRAHWQSQLTRALDLAGDHLSLYQLTIESGTAFFRDHVEALSGDDAADLFDDTQKELNDAGLAAYEISNHARPGQECRHNLVYWQGGEYVGIGPGAHGRLQSGGQHLATHQIHAPEAWLEALRQKGHGTAKQRRLSDAERAQELLILGLRLSDGIALDRLHARTGIYLADHLDIDQVNSLVQAGFLSLSKTHLKATGAGRVRLNAVIEKISV